MTEFNVGDATKMLNDMKKIVEENHRMKSTFEKYQTYAQQLKKLGDDLHALSKEIDPFQSTSRSEYGNQKEILEELHAKLLSGVHVTRKLVETTYPSLTPNQLVYIMATLQKLEGVKKTKDGREVRLFI